MNVLYRLFTYFSLTLLALTSCLTAQYPHRNFINTKHAVGLPQPTFINAKNFIPYVYTRADLPVHLRVTGFVRSDTVVSSRPYEQMNLTDAYGIWPVQKIPTLSSTDGYNHPTMSLLNGIYQIGFNLKTTPHHHTSLEAFINGDFSGMTSSYGDFIVRFAYFKITHENLEFLVGQYTNPLGIYENFPHVVSYNYGAPFTPTSYNPQLLISYARHNIRVTACAYTQYIFNDIGQAQTFTNAYTGDSPRYVSNSMMPILHGRLAYESDAVEIGAGFNVKRITARINTPDLLPTHHESFASPVTMAFIILRNAQLATKTQILWGSDGTDLMMLGGYAIKSTAANSQRTYRKLNFVSGWTEIESSRLLRGILQPGVFIGYTKNLGTEFGPLELFATTQTGPDDNDVTLEHPKVYSLQSLQINTLGQKSIRSILRCSPRLWVFATEGLQLGVEAQIDRTTYGYLDDLARPTVNQSTVNSCRLIATVQFYF